MDHHRDSFRNKGTDSGKSRIKEGNAALSIYSAAFSYPQYTSGSSAHATTLYIPSLIPQSSEP